LSLALGLGVLACAAEDPSAAGSTNSFQNSVTGDAGTLPVPTGTTGGLGGTGAQAGIGGTGSLAGGAAGGNGGVCAVQTVESGRIIPDMLIVLDRSGSMRGNGVNRWDPSVMALKTLTSSLGSTINFGLMAYPGKSTAMPVATQDCSTLPLFDQIACIAAEAAGGIATLDTCGAGSVDVAIGPNNGAKIATALDSMAPNGATPTAVTLKAAHTALGSAIAALDETVRPKYVLLVTDGAPNCSDPQSTGGRGFDNSAVDQSVAEITAMAKDGIKTYVIGYGTKNDQQLNAALNRMAVAGGTGDQQHHAIEDGMGLLTEFQKIAGAAAGCEFVLTTPPTDPRYVEVKLDGNQINLKDANGWNISDDRRRISVTGSACSALSALNEKHNLTVRVLCEPVVLQ
jgi:hypothetical protein